MTLTAPGEQSGAVVGHQVCRDSLWQQREANAQPHSSKAGLPLPAGTGRQPLSLLISCHTSTPRPHALVSPNSCALPLRGLSCFYHGALAHAAALDKSALPSPAKEVSPQQSHPALMPPRCQALLHLPHLQAPCAPRDSQHGLCRHRSSVSVPLRPKARAFLCAARTERSPDSTGGRKPRRTQAVPSARHTGPTRRKKSYPHGQPLQRTDGDTGRTGQQPLRQANPKGSSQSRVNMSQRPPESTFGLELLRSSGSQIQSPSPTAPRHLGTCQNCTCQGPAAPTTDT